MVVFTFMEIWRTIKGYENYEVSNLGNVKNIKYNRYIKKCFDSDNYLIVGLYCKGKSRIFKVHRLVAIAFIYNTENKPQVNHINGIKIDNRVENLEWCTPKENTAHAIKTGLFNISGFNSNKSKLNKSQLKEIRDNKFNLTYRKLALNYNVSCSTISDIINFKTYKNE